MRILDDLGDFISYALDPGFGTVRYAERIASSRAEYGPVSEAADSGYVMREFYRPWLIESFRAAGTAPDLVLLTVPFPGCLVGAVAAAREARSAFGPDTRIAAGRGLRVHGAAPPKGRVRLRRLRLPLLRRGIRRPGLPDRGLGGRTRGRAKRPLPGARPAAPGTGPSSTSASIPWTRPRAIPPGAWPCPDSARFAALEEEALRSTFPDYLNADFAAYVRAPYSENPMHRIWSDAPWLKYQLAYGCYWHRCSFCDTRLDYVRHYLPSKPGALMDAALAARERTGLAGIHFTDEALPLPGLMEFARLNRERGRPFSFWGNVRFDRAWTTDRCALLASSGLVAVSGGIEIATDRGLEMTGKGFTFPDLVRALSAFKRSGILVHGYLIYGFPAQTPQDLADSAEAVRQLFAAGLLDSAFWHRFVLTRHSEMYGRWLEGREPGLEPIDREGSFASNDLEFRGSQKWDPYDKPLETLLADWMSGSGLDRPIRPLVAGSPKPSLAADRVERLARDAQENPRGEGGPPVRSRAHWLAGLPAVSGGLAGSVSGGRGKPPAPGNLARLEWTDRGEPSGLALPRLEAERLAAALAELARNPDGLPLAEFLERAGLPAATGGGSGGGTGGRSILADLRGNGLVIV